jgi:hypothetical protein
VKIVKELELKTEYKYIHFVEGGIFNNKPQYLCRNNKSKSILALIFYYKEWKQYCFTQYEQNVVFNDGCLKDIIDFIKQLKGNI